MSVIRKVQVRRGTAAAWSSANPVLSSGEFGYDETNDKVKIGDGATAWNSLAFAHYKPSEVNALIADFQTSDDVQTAIEAGASFINILDHGADPTGVADSTSAILAADAAAEAGGKDVYFPAGTYRVDGLLRLADTASGLAIRTMRPRRWVGDGAWMDATASTDVAYRGTILDCRNSTAPALLLKPRGFFELRGIAFHQKGTAHTQPYIKITNTTTHIIGCSFIGHDSKNGSTCDQPAIVFGGTTLTVIGNDDDSPFQGYGTTVERCYFDRIRHVATWQIFANDIKFLNNVVWVSCGGDTIFVCNPVIAGQFAAGATIADNTIQMTNYTTWAKLTRASNWWFRGNGLYDAVTPLDADGIIHLTDCPVVRVDTGIMPAYTNLIKNISGSAAIVIEATQAKETLFDAQFPVRANNFRSRSVTIDGGNNGLVMQAHSGHTESNSDIVGVRARSKDGSVTYFQQERSGIIYLGGTVQCQLLANDWTIRNDGFRRVGAGGNIFFDSGTGGSVNFYRGFRHEFEDHTGADIAHFQSSGNIRFFGLPTSDPGVSGRIWNDGGTLRIST